MPVSPRTATSSSATAGKATARTRSAPAPAARAEWTFLTNHAHVLICLAVDGEQRMRDLATRVGITERTVQLIVADLVEGGFIHIQKSGRCNRYVVMRGKPLRHPVEAHRRIDDLLILGT
jgi:DNA-binding MarR family transcriptional regulator